MPVRTMILTWTSCEAEEEIYTYATWLIFIKIFLMYNMITLTYSAIVIMANFIIL